MTCSVIDEGNPPEYDYRLMKNSSEIVSWQNSKEFNFILESVNDGCCYTCQARNTSCGIPVLGEESEDISFDTYGAEKCYQ